MRGLVVCHGRLPRPRPRPALRRRSAARCPTRPRRSRGWSPALHDDDGRVQIPGFYDDVLELTDDERELFARVPYDDARVPRASRSRARCTARRGYTHARAARRPADRRGQRHRRRLPGRGRQDDRAQRRVRQAVVPAGRQPGPARRSPRRSSSSSPSTRPGRHHWRRSSGRARASRPAWCRSTRPAYEALTAAISEAFDGLPVLPTREGGSGPEAAIQTGARRADGLPRRRPARRPDPRAEREGHPVDALPGAEAAALLWSKFAAAAARPCAQRNGGYVHGADGQPTVTTRRSRPHDAHRIGWRACREPPPCPRHRFDITHHTLDNGLRVVARARPVRARSSASPCSTTSASAPSPRAAPASPTSSST